MGEGEGRKRAPYLHHCLRLVGHRIASARAAVYGSTVRLSDQTKMTERSDRLTDLTTLLDAMLSVLNH